jgi:Zn finger protein HypA/HybF involved in hydrogenase expression
MGTGYHCRCNDCSREFKAYAGDGFYFKGLICQQCGAGSAIPRFAPRAGTVVAANALTEGVQPTAADSGAKIRFSDEELKALLEPGKFPRNGDTWDSFEIDALVRLRNPCKCGGLVDLSLKSARQANLNMHTRCPECRSKNLTTGGFFLFD